MNDQAAELFESFHEQPPKEGDLLTIEQPAQVQALVVGEVHGISYIAAVSKEKYFHKFGPGARPLLVVSEDGSQAIMVGGNYKFTDRGFVG
jgi:hypothetical protein